MEITFRASVAWIEEQLRTHPEHAERVTVRVEEWAALAPLVEHAWDGEHITVSGPAHAGMLQGALETLAPTDDCG